MTHSRTRRPFLLILSLGLIASAFARADEPTVPLQLQVDLTAKVLEYVREPVVQGADVLRIGILTRSGSVKSGLFAAELKTALGRVGPIAGRPHEELTLQWSGPDRLIADAKEKKLLVIYLTPGLDEDIVAISRALNGMTLVTISAVDTYVAHGAILGFTLISGHPRMLFNLAQAKRQQVSFRAAAMKLMRIVE